MDETTEDGLAFADDEGGWEVGTIWTDAGGANGFAIRADIFTLHYYVIFTTFAQCGTEATATPTGVGYEQVHEAYECCIIYNIWHNSLDFSMEMLYNKA